MVVKSGLRAEGSKRELHTDVAGPEAQTLVKPLRIHAGAVGGQLNEPAIPFARTADDPLHHRGADSPPAKFASHADRLHLPAPGALVAEPGQEAELQGGDNFIADGSDSQFMIGVRRDRVERPEVPLAGESRLGRIGQGILRG